MIVVADTGPVYYLILSGHIDLVRWKIESGRWAAGRGSGGFNICY
jgi:hypothetical protein